MEGSITSFREIKAFHPDLKVKGGYLEIR